MMGSPIKILPHFEAHGRAPGDVAKVAALQLFKEIFERHGEEYARSIFAMWGNPPSKSQINEFENMRLIDRLDTMPGGPNVNELARQIAHEIRTSPTPQEISSVERQIRKLLVKRKTNSNWPQNDDG